MKLDSTSSLPFSHQSPKAKDLRRIIVRAQLFLAISCAIFSASTQAQLSISYISECKNLIEAGFFEGDMEKVLVAHSMLERAIEGNANLALAHYYLGYIEYQLATSLMNKGERDENTSANNDSALIYIDSAIHNLRKSIDLDGKSVDAAEAHALLSIVYGQKIRLKPGMGTVLGLRSKRVIRRAKKLNPTNPRVVLADAIYNYNTPRKYGGSQESGLAGFKRVTDIFSSEKESSPFLPSWGEIEAYTWMGLAYLEMEQYQHARHALEKALEINPEYGWVKHGLLIELEAKDSSEAKSKL